MRQPKSINQLQAEVRQLTAGIERRQKLIDEQRQAPSKKGPVFIGVDLAKNKDTTVTKRFSQ
ncbi:hypothetical protein [Gilvimarinus japonicus]|uniref:Transposase n=1 Tax=Gilvimarinus japonicus TaxID=1796469 RepID=A0ABV7HN11_9GAMM